MPPKIPKTAKMTYSPKDIEQLVLEDAQRRGVKPTIARALIGNREVGRNGMDGTEPVFDGFEVDFEVAAVAPKQAR